MIESYMYETLQYLQSDRLLLMDIVVRPVINPYSVGIVPIKLRFDKSNVSNDDNNPISLGNIPVSPVL